MFIDAIPKKMELGALKLLLRAWLGQKFLKVQLVKPLEVTEPLKWSSHRSTFSNSWWRVLIWSLLADMQYCAVPIFHTGLITESHVKNWENPCVLSSFQHSQLWKKFRESLVILQMSVATMKHWNYRGCYTVRIKGCHFKHRYDLGLIGSISVAGPDKLIHHAILVLAKACNSSLMSAKSSKHIISQGLFFSIFNHAYILIASEATSWQNLNQLNDK